MSISLPVTKILWARAGSTCTLCRQQLIRITELGKPALLGEAAHIIAEREDGPRGTNILDLSERDSYFNLILLCPTCHTAVDKDPGAYPPEKLHMLKAQHEIRQSGQLVVDDIPETPPIAAENKDKIINFATEWANFYPFYAQFFSRVQLIQMKNSEEGVDFYAEAMEWHRRRDRLKELLFLAGEENINIHRIPNWERLKSKDSFIREANYLTPFSFVLDFVNPFFMVANHSDALWAAFNISHEFMDYLCFKYPELKICWKLNQ